VSLAKKLRHVLEWLGFSFFYHFVRILPLDTASYLGGFVARLVRPFFKQIAWRRKIW